MEHLMNTSQEETETRYVADLKPRYDKNGKLIQASIHGTYSAYINKKCRCDLCRAANAKKERDRKTSAERDYAEIDRRIKLIDSGRCPECEHVMYGMPGVQFSQQHESWCTLQDIIL